MKLPNNNIFEIFNNIFNSLKNFFFSSNLITKTSLTKNISKYFLDYSAIFLYFKKNNCISPINYYSRILEINKLCEFILKSSSINLLISGKSGIGKTYLIYILLYLQSLNQLPIEISSYKIYKFKLAELIKELIFQSTEIKKTNLIENNEVENNEFENTEIKKTNLIENNEVENNKNIIPNKILKENIIAENGDYTNLNPNKNYLNIIKILEEIVEIFNYFSNQLNTIIIFDDLHLLNFNIENENILSNQNIKELYSLLFSIFSCSTYNFKKIILLQSKDLEYYKLNDFEHLELEVLSNDEIFNILKHKKEFYETKYSVLIPNFFLKYIIKISNTAIQNIAFPKKAFILLEQLLIKRLCSQDKINFSLQNILYNYIVIFKKLRFYAYKINNIYLEYILFEYEKIYKKYYFFLILNYIQLNNFEFFWKYLNINIFNFHSFQKWHLTNLKKNYINIIFQLNTNNLSPIYTEQIFTIFKLNNKYKLSKYRISIFILKTIFKKSFKLLPLFLKKLNISNFLNYYYKFNDNFSTDFEKKVLNIQNINKKELYIFYLLKKYLKTIQPKISLFTLYTFLSAVNLKLTKTDYSILKTLLGYYKKEKNKNIFTFTNTYYTNFFTTYPVLNVIKSYKLLENILNISLDEISLVYKKRILLNLDLELKKRVMGQEEAIKIVTSAIRYTQIGLKNDKKPIASFFFCGSTGVGKTELAKALTELLYKSEANMIRFDMSEFSEKHAISRLIGAPAGYVGYEDGGELTTKVLNNPYSVILFDEMEKAHQDLYTILLQVLDDGRLTDSKKQLVSFANTIIIITSNIGAQIVLDFYNEQLKLLNIKNQNEIKVELSKKKNHIKKYIYKNFLDNSNYIRDFYDFFSKYPISDLEKNLLNIEVENNLKNKNKFLNQEEQKPSIPQKALDKLKNTLKTELIKKFSPEFINRFDDLIIFKPITKEILYTICHKYLNNLKTYLQSKKIFLTIPQNMIDFFVNSGYEPEFGARPLKRVIKKTLEEYLTMLFLETNNFLHLRNENSYSLYISLKFNNNIITSTLKEK
uniref:Protease ATP binding subunit n=1 Tax=Spumella sp. NIES-1846 TaxID=2490549 RepID=A0A455RET9_9STRA|nr:protease ATP binding subunit [Spumella sp. NIES-1846]